MKNASNQRNLFAEYLSEAIYKKETINCNGQTLKYFLINLVNEQLIIKFQNVDKVLWTR